MPGTVHVVDDDEAVRDSVRLLLEQEGLTVRTYADARALLATGLPVAAEPPLAACVVTDFRMPEIDGLQLQSRLVAQGVTLPVIVITSHGDVPAAVRALKAGAIDFLEKPFHGSQLIDAVSRALDADRKARAADDAAADATQKIARLTAREREVLMLLVVGKSNKEIGRELGTSPRTIDVHRARVFDKLEAETLPGLVHLVLAAQAGQHQRASA